MVPVVRTLLLLFGACICLQVESAKLPATITACKRNDPDLEKCVLTEARKYYKEVLKGIPELGVPPMNPLIFPNDIAYNTGKNGIDLKIKNAILEGASGMKIHTFKFDIPNKKIHIDAKCNITVSGNFESKGEFLLLPMNGKGAMKIQFESLRFKSSLDWSLIKGSDNLDHINVTNPFTQYSIKNIKVTIRGLETKEMDQRITKLFDENWRLVEEDIAPEFVSLFNQELVKRGNIYFRRYPYNELFPL